MKKLITSSLFLACTIIIANAQIINVPGDQPSIQAGIDAASEGDTVLVSDSTYYENINFKEKAITVASQFIIDGDTSHISKTVINGSQWTDPNHGSTVAITNVGTDNSVLAGFTIKGGSGSYLEFDVYKMIAGGGIFIEGCGATIRNNIIDSNIVEAAVGGVLLLPGESDTLMFYDNIVQNNEVRSKSIAAAGGIWLYGSKNSVVYLYDNRITKNRVNVEAIYKAIGGGISIETDYSNGSDIRVYNNIVDHNELNCRSSHGGGIYVVYSKHNSDPMSSTQVRIYNNLVYNNYSEDKGGGIGVWSMGYEKITSMGASTPVDPIITNNTIIGNNASAGSGLYNYDARTVMFNNILWNEKSSGEIFDDSIHYCFLSESAWWFKEIG